jgi:hypothetical protein
MATTINFPDSPALNDTYAYGSITYKWNGTQWFVYEINYVDYDELSVALKAIVALAGTEIDWDLGIEFTKTLTGTTTLTDTHLVKGKVIVLHITGDYSITFPAYWDIMKSSEIFSGNISNTIIVHCVESESGSEEVEYSINQKDV